MSENEVAKAVKTLVSALNDDKAYRYSWQSNIAMAFSDACVQAGVMFPQLHDVSNKAADSFLRILCRDIENE